MININMNNYNYSDVDLYKRYFQFIKEQYRECGCDIDESDVIAERYNVDVKEFNKRNSGIIHLGFHGYSYVMKVINNEELEDNIANVGCEFTTADGYVFFHNIGDCTMFLEEILHQKIFLDISDLNMSVDKFVKACDNELLSYYDLNEMIIHHMSYNDTMTLDDLENDEVNDASDVYVAKMAIVFDYGCEYVYDAACFGHIEILTVRTEKQLRQGKIWWRY